MISEEENLILRELRRDSRQSTRQIARNIGLSATTVHRVLSSLLKNDYIQQYTIIPDWNKLEKLTLAYILVSVDYDHINMKKMKQADIAEILRKHPFVFDASTITGNRDIILKVRAKDTKELDHFIDYIRSVGGVHQTETLVVLREATRHDNPFEKPWFE